MAAENLKKSTVYEPKQQHLATLLLAAFLPWHGLTFLLHNHFRGFLVPGAVFLVVCGCQARVNTFMMFGPGS